MDDQSGGCHITGLSGVDPSSVIAAWEGYTGVPFGPARELRDLEPPLAEVIDLDAYRKARASREPTR